MKCSRGAQVNILKLISHSKMLSTTLHITMVLSVASPRDISESLEYIKISTISHKFARPLFCNSGCDMSVHSFLGYWVFFFFFLTTTAFLYHIILLSSMFKYFKLPVTW